MKKIYLMFFFISGVWSLQAQYDDPYQYYPMKTGNYWYYSAGPGYFYSEKVYADSTDSTGNRFFWMYDRSDYSNYPPSYRIDTNYFFYIGNSTEYFKLDALSGEKWWIYTGNDGDTTLGKYCKVTNIMDGYYLGVETRFKRYTFYSRVNWGNDYQDYYDHYEVLAYGIGKIYVDNDSNYPYVLLGAIIDGEIIGEPVSVEETIVEKLPDNFELYQNYPNPFNPTTTITFSLPKYSHVVIKVFDILGKEIVTLVNESKSAGFHNVNFDASRLTSGSYFYTINANNFVQSKKMVLLK